jgi:hypothetical protein
MPVTVRTLVVAAVVAAGTVLGPAAAGAVAATGTPVPLSQWVATFCQTFASYETDALAAQAKLRSAVAGVADSTAGASAAADVAAAFRKAGQSARTAAAAATANGVPDVQHGKALTRELATVLETASRAYAREAERASSLPAEPKELTKAAKKIGTRLVQGLDANGAHAKRLQKLDASNVMGGALAADPTCAAAARSGGTTP